MLEKITEKNVWEHLRDDKKPVMVYGMGNGAEKIINTMKNYNIDVCEIFASDAFVRGHSFLGKKVLKYSDVCEKYQDFNVVMGFAVHDEIMLNTIKNINTHHPVFAPDVPVVGDGLFTREFVAKNEEYFDKVFNSLADERSKEVYIDIIQFKISGKVNYLYTSTDSKLDTYKSILKLSDDEIILDLGAYDGDTIREILSCTNGKYHHITAVEPDSKNFKKLLLNTEDMINIKCLNIGISNECKAIYFDSKAGRNSRLSDNGKMINADCIDNICSYPPTLIKMDIEGSEMQALCGGEKTISKYSPKLYVCAYHKNEDMFALPMKIWSIDEEYKIYFRHSPYVPAWESNFYCVK